MQFGTQIGNFSPPNITTLSHSTGSIDPYIRDAAQPKKLLSILCQGRNDNYMGNFSWRIETALNNHARNLRLLGAEHEVEVLVADWGSERPFYMDLNLSPQARLCTKFLLVPPDIAKSYDKDSGFAATPPTNALARRSCGKYLLFADSDIFIPLSSMATLLYHLRKGYIHDYSLDDSFFWASKYHIPYDLIARSPFIEEIDEHIEKNWHTYSHESVSKENFQGCGVALLMQRNIWLDSRGWDEKLIYWGWNDIDWHRRLSMKYRWEDLETRSMKIFHMEHYKNRFQNYEAELNRKANAHVEPTCYAPNADNWGLRDHQLKMVDGYGLIVDPSSAESCAANNAITVSAENAALKSVAQITSENPVYHNLCQRFAFDPGSWFVNKNELTQLLNQLQPRSVCEIGSWLGASARFFAEFPFVERVYCVDHWDRLRVENYVPGGMPEPLMNNIFEQFMANALHQNCATKLYPIRLDSVQGAKYCIKNNMRFDLIYIDGEHSTLGVARDITWWEQLLAPNGLLCGDDWTWQTEPNNVAGAVISVAKQRGWEVLSSNNFWLVASPERLRK